MAAFIATALLTALAVVALIDLAIQVRRYPDESESE